MATEPPYDENVDGPSYWDRLQAAVALHQEDGAGFCAAPDCSGDWPCATARAAGQERLGYDD
jgi:hypothetical protein